MDATESLAGIRRYLRRNKTLQQLRTYADALFAVVDSEVIFTGANFEGASGNAQVRSYDKGQVLSIVEDLISEMVNAGVNQWTPAQCAADYRRVMTYSNRSYSVAAL